MSEEMQNLSAVRGARKARISPELSEVLHMLKALERNETGEKAQATAV